MRYFSSFAGVEGFGLGLEGDTCVGFSEYDKSCSQVLRYKYPDIKNYGDITKIDWNDVPDFDMLVGGSPCQDLSVAGKRAGLAGERSSLFHEYVRAIREKHPAYFIWENVEGAFSASEGWDFAIVQIDLAESGYALWWGLLDAQYFDTPQERHRIFIVGSRTGSLPEILFEQKDDCGDIAPEREAEARSKSLSTKSGRVDPTAQTHVAHSLDTRQSMPSSTQRRSKENLIAQTLDTRRGGSHIESTTLIAQNQRREVRRRNPDRAGSLSATQSTTQFQALETGIGIRRFTPLESERIMGWPDNHTKYGTNEKGECVEISDAQRYKMCGNGVCPRVVREVRKYLIL